MAGEAPPAAGFASTRFEVVDGVRLRVAEAGEGEPVVLLAGWPQSIHAFRHVVPALAARYRVIGIDPPGLGWSDPLDRPPDTGAVADVLLHVIDRLAPGPVRLVGHDIGAWLAYALAARDPARFRSLVVIDAVVPGLGGAAAYALTPERVVKTWHFFFNALPDLPEILIEGRERAYLEWLFRSRSADFERTFTPADIDEYVRCYARPGAMKAGFDWYRAIFDSMAQNRETAAGARLPMPVLAIGGERWLGAAMAANFEAVCDRVEGAVVRGSAHFVPEEAADEIVRLCLGFFARQG